MLEIIFGIAALFLILLGLFELVRIVTFFAFKTSSDKNLMFVIPVKGHNEEIEYLLRSTTAKLKFMGGTCQKIICLDCGMDKETKKICILISRDKPFIEIYDLVQFKDILENIKMQS